MDDEHYDNDTCHCIRKVVGAEINPGGHHGYGQKDQDCPDIDVAAQSEQQKDQH